MASKIMINPTGVNQSISGLNQCLARLANVQSGIAGLRSSVDGRILARHGIGSRFAAANSSMSRIYGKVESVQTFSGVGLAKYSGAEARISSKASEVEEQFNLLDKAAQERWVSNTYDKYHQITGNIGNLLHGLQYTAGAGIAHLLGYRFNQGFQLADDILMFGKRIPLGSAIKAIEGSRAHNIARYLVGGVNAFVFHRNKSLTDLLYKKLTRAFPSDVANLFHSVNRLKDAAGISGFSAVKDHAWDIVKSGGKMVRANAILATVITAGTEAVGSGIKISENYRLYSGDVERLKTENAKVVASAAYKTVVVSGASLGGAVIGGALGSLLGPIGTVAGASAGAFVGSMIGDALSAKTPAFIENGFVAAKDQIHAVTEGVRSGYNTVKEGVKDVAETAGKLVSGAKEAAGNFFGGAKKLFSFGG